jgi:hypothetical protein
MGKGFIRRKGKLILYEKFKKSQSFSIKNGDILAEKNPPNKGVQKEKVISKYIDNKVPIIIIITSLYTNSGCTFLSKAFEEYLKVLNYNVKRMDQHNIISEDLINYNFVIYDLGRYSEIPQTLKHLILHAHIKIMVNLSSDIHLRCLSQFIKHGSNPNQWMYFFNLISKREHKKISELMEDYQYYFIPALYSNDQSAEKEIRNCIKSVLMTKE